MMLSSCSKLLLRAWRTEQKRVLRRSDTTAKPKPQSSPDYLVRSGFVVAPDQAPARTRLTVYLGNGQAVCLVVRDQHADIREWLQYHSALGVSKFYVFDNNSSSPMLSLLEDFVTGGVVEYHFLTSFRHHSNKCERAQRVRKDASHHQYSLFCSTVRQQLGVCINFASRRTCATNQYKLISLYRTRRAQLHVYDTCIQHFGTRHRWMAFIDAGGPQLHVCLQWHSNARALALQCQKAPRCVADEFFVLRDQRTASLPALLREFEDFGALAVNWQVQQQGATYESNCACPHPLPCNKQLAAAEHSTVPAEAGAQAQSGVTCSTPDALWQCAVTTESDLGKQGRLCADSHSCCHAR